MFNVSNRYVNLKTLTKLTCNFISKSKLNLHESTNDGTSQSYLNRLWWLPLDAPAIANADNTSTS